MVKIYSSPLQEIYYDEENSIIKNIWLAVDIKFGDMKLEMQNWMDKFREKQPKFMLTDSSYGIVVPTDIQDWIVSFLFPEVIEKGVSKYAIILSEEFFAQLSVEQMFDEIRDDSDTGFKQYNFENEADAMKWLLK